MRFGHAYKIVEVAGGFGVRIYDVKEVLFEGETAEVYLETDREKLQAWLLHDEWKALEIAAGDKIAVAVDAKKGTLFAYEENNS